MALDCKKLRLTFCKGFLKYISKKFTFYTSNFLVPQDVRLNSANPNQCSCTEWKTVVMKANHHIRALHHLKEKRKFPVNSSFTPWHLVETQLSWNTKSWGRTPRKYGCMPMRQTWSFSSCSLSKWLLQGSLGQEFDLNWITHAAILFCHNRSERTVL